MSTRRHASLNYFTKDAADFSWQDDAACMDGDLSAFFPPSALGHTREAYLGVEGKRICGGCPVRSQCLTHAMTYPEHFGIWGGTTPEERRDLRRREGRRAR